MSKSEPHRFAVSLLLVLIVPGFLFGSGLSEAGETTLPEVGAVPPPSEDDPGYLEELDSQLDLSFQYAHFTGEDMRDTYDGLPMFAAAFSFQTAPRSRFFLSLGYGETSGDPYHDTPGISAPDQVNIRYAPLQIGLKIDLAQSTRFQVYAGAALEFAWMEETVPVLTEDGTVTNLASSGVNHGFLLIFGPQLVLGQSRQAIGLEVGWGGSKGTVTAAGHDHDIDMTGYRGRLYLALGL